MKWFRYYAEALTDPKVQQLSATLFRDWINVLCLACEEGSEAGEWGYLPADKARVAFALRKNLTNSDRALRALEGAGLLVRTRRGWTPYNWLVRQHRSDDVASRVRSHRKRSMKQDRNVTRNNFVSPPEIRDQSTEEQSTDGRHIAPNNDQSFRRREP